MNQDLEWLAINEPEWAMDDDNYKITKHKGKASYVHYVNLDHKELRAGRQSFSRSQWQAARDELLAPEIGVVESFLGSPFSTPEEDEAFAAIEKKQERYQDAQGEDWIDEAARTFTAEEFRGAMRFSIGKYNRRMGKKDELIKEIEKMRDYCSRWLEVEKGR